MRKSSVLLYRNPYWRTSVMRYKGFSESWDRVVQNLAVVEYLEAVPRPYLGQKACMKYRKQNLVPGVLKGLGSGYFDIPIAVRVADLVSFRERGGFLQKEYKLIIENKIKYVKPVDLILDQVTMTPEHIVLQEISELTPPPELTEEEKKVKAKFELLMTTHFYGRKTYGPKNPIPLWYKEDGGVV
jgi:ribosomal protein L25 (general stress protein Ctc)